ncbi:hypothetical protein FNV43_RR08819 [Rhamnella rubrinervis]|uniref:Leucine-rich repeat-containing N-terminal plant-type domain-containing protein n=1 Tax=Rhamnella rubrinervis TaxID=2594499 RepID=A0A8K0H9Y7_9ROSA|nr:hypothetical protein FNV43_RR08819 [Rhamnella rubrinervis]
MGGIFSFRDQRSLLLQLKNNLKFDSTRSKKLVQWNEISDCFWQGVICEEGLVAGLNLSNESITGGIENSSLFNLEYLKSLDLSYNKINSMIPSRIGDLTNLSHLNLSNAGFEGQIPGGMSNLTRLVALDLSIQANLVPSSLKLENPNLSMLIKNLKQLEELYLDGLNITVRGNEWCQALSSSVLNLRVLSLSHCNLSGPVDKSLLKLKSLSVIRLDSNKFSASVPEFFVSFSNLVSLRLSTCQLNGVFPKEIFKVPTLQSLDISNNPSLQGSLPEFSKNSALQRLVLGNTNFSGRYQHQSVIFKTCPVPSTHREGLHKLVYLDLSFSLSILLISGVVRELIRRLEAWILFEKACKFSLPLHIPTYIAKSSINCKPDSKVSNRDSSLSWQMGCVSLLPLHSVKAQNDSASTTSRSCRRSHRVHSAAPPDSNMK